MRKLKVFEHISLDGVIQQSADGTAFSQLDWTAPYRTPEGRDAVLEAQGPHFDLLLGRITYDIWASYWPGAPASPMADRINAAKKYVATHRPEDMRWGPVEGLGDNFSEEVRRIKAEPGPDLLLWGSSTLTSELLANGLADEVTLLVYPVLLGSGKRFLAANAPMISLELQDSRRFPSGIVWNRFRPLIAK
ncbi:MAG: dihydrofolate reductase [Proteobacteria bacterium]|nr:MAG: dihydrofolate reductase [Pseudomonadota bacterium]